MILPDTRCEGCTPKFSNAPPPLPNCIFYGKKSIETVQHLTCILTILTLHPRQIENPGGIPGKNAFLLLLFDQGMSVVILANFVDNETAFKTKLRKRHPDWCFTRIFSLTRNKFRESTFTHSHRQPPLPSYILIFILIFIPIST